MNRRSVGRRLILGGVLAGVGMSVSGCGSDLSHDEMTAATGSGFPARSGDLLLRDIIAVSSAPGTACLLVTIFNQSDRDDAMVRVEVQNGSAMMRPSPTPLPPRGVAVFGVDTSLTNDPAYIELRGAPVKPGFVAQLSFVFASAAPVQSGALVMPPRPPYDEVPLHPQGS